jgi:hypothetical protein
MFPVAGGNSRGNGDHYIVSTEVHRKAAGIVQTIHTFRLEGMSMTEIELTSRVKLSYSPQRLLHRNFEIAEEIFIDVASQNLPKPDER